MTPFNDSNHVFERGGTAEPSGDATSGPAGAVLQRVRRSLRWGLQSLVDFLVADACNLCGKRPHGGSDHRPVALPPEARYLAAKSVVPLFGTFPIENRPFCERCLARFETATELGLIGSYCSCGRVTTRNGDAFGPHAATVLGGDDPPDESSGGSRAPFWVAAPFIMNDISLKTIHLIKFSGRRSLVPLVAGPVAHALRAQIRPEWPQAVLVPVPMDPASLRRRGFNQAELLADEISAVAGVPVVRDALRKVLQTPPQSLTDRQKRAQNVRRAFVPHRAGVEGDRVLLVDDLVTTGATASACASCLLAAGARSVAVVCVARAL